MPKQLNMFGFDEKLNDDSDIGVIEAKKCSKCKELLPLSRFAKCHGNTYLRPECRQCNSDATKVRNDIRKIHGMPTDGYICPICSGDEEEVGDISKRGSWVLDHCHKTSTFRGWLCHKCNRSLGGFNDSVDILKRAIIYLQEHKEKLNETDT